jgi:hypothetical protein
MKRTALLFVRTLTLAAMVLCAMLAQSANTIAAVVLPDASSFLQVTAQGAGPALFGTTSLSNSVTNGGSSATASITSQPSPLLTGSVSANGTGNQGTVFAQYQYYFSVVGPDAVLVPVIISANAAVSPSVIQNAAFLSLSTSSGAGELARACQSSVVGNCGGSIVPSFSYLATKDILSNSLNIIGLTLSLIANTNTGNTSETGSGFIDPILTIDPAFARAGEFSLAFSAGVGNTATPLPAALPLFGTGLGLMGLVGWWRKRRAEMVA